MTGYREFFVGKRTGTYADTLAAVGLTKMLRALQGGDGSLVTVTEQSSRFCVELAEPIELNAERVSILQREPLYSFIVTKPGENAPDGIVPYDYVANKAIADAYREERKRKKGGEEREELPNVSPRFYVYQKVNVLQGISARNKLLEEIVYAKPEELAQAVIAKLKALANGQLTSEAATKFNPKVAAVQVFNPSVGKGINRLKADGATRGPLPSSFVDWFEEWLRFIGSDIVMSGNSIGDDIKMNVVVPAKASYRHLNELEEHKFSYVRTSRKADILAVFDLVLFLVSKVDVSTDAFWSFRMQVGETPRDIFSAVQTAYFKSLGSARPISNIASIGLPHWFKVRDEADIARWETLIKEHRDVLFLLDEDKTEEAELLHLYRDFLSGDDWLSFLRFLGSYGCWSMKRREAKKPMRSFVKNHLEELFTLSQPRLPVVDIINNSGFQNIAKAIRQATVSEQYAKAKGRQIFEVRYGLFQEIKRKAKFREELLTVISDFISQFNYENARREEQLREAPGRRRKRVSMQDLQEFAELMDRFPSQKETEAIAMLLIAFASCKDGKGTDADTEDQEVDLTYTSEEEEI
ncbi:MULTISPECIES: hypothetical protein [Brevibacillus]|uniref:hypothetical protein n=1 Tax=Brevibacillus TaxID=55080 RepID=UPI000ECB973F|nr:hypothetical protein [Brevibacillus sp.]HBZ82375.1 hypothetical protein [Brevibacillus sp.]